MPTPPSVAALLAAIGGALGAAASVATSAVTSAISGATSALSGAIGALGSVLSAGASMVSGAIGLIGGALGAIGGAITGAVGGILGALTQAFSSIVSGIGEAIGAALKVGVAVIGGALALAGAAVFGFVKVLSSAMADFQRTAQEIASIRNNTGLSLGAAQTGYNSLTAAGMSGQGASAFLGSDAMRGGIGRERAAAWNLPSPDGARFAEEFARKAAGMDIFQKRAMADSISGGKASPELLQLMNQRPADLRENQRFSSSVNSSLGVTPEMIRKIADEFPLMMSKVSLFVDAVKNRFVASMLPIVSGALESLTKYLEKNSENIANAIKKGVTWLYADFPQLLVNASSISITALEAIAGGFFSFGDAVVVGLRAISAGKSGLFSMLEAMASGIDSFVTLLRTLSGAFAAAMAGIESNIALNPILNAGAKAAGLNPQVRNPITAFKEAQNLIPQTDLSGTLANFKNSGVTDKWADNAQGFMDARRSQFSTISDKMKGARDSAQNALGTPEERRSTIEELLKQVSKNTKDSADEQRKQRENPGHVGVLNALQGAIGKTAYLDATR